jgi:acyl-CoA synthetase (AMP-forming)/AMP-acid ligase II
MHEVLAGLPARIAEIPDRWALAAAASSALVDRGRTRTYGDLARGRDAFARILADHGVRPGDRVMVVGENSAEMVALLLAIVSLDAWMVNVNARLTDREIDAVRDHCGARRVIYLGSVSEDAKAHAARHGAAALEVDDWERMSISARNDACVPEPVESDPARRVAALIYTTGTTGNPKGVMLTNRNLLFIAGVSGALRRLSAKDRVYGVLPITHVYGLASMCLGALLAGGCLVLQARYSPQAMADAFATGGITVSQGVPAMYAKLLEHLSARGEPWRAPALRFIYAGGSPLDPALKREVEAVSGLTLHNGYGLTEASPTITQTRLDEPRRDCSVGKVLPGVEIRLVDPYGQDVAPGEPGELWSRGPNVMRGYYRSPEMTAAAIRQDGWLSTGDVARIDPDGAVFIVGRTKEVIIRSGFNVYPVEVEAVLSAHPDVTQSAVVGREVPGNEEVVAFVELRPGARATADALAQFAAASLAPYKRPAQIVILPSLPAAASGKILKHRLKEMARESPATHNDASQGATTTEEKS